MIYGDDKDLTVQNINSNANNMNKDIANQIKKQQVIAQHINNIYTGSDDSTKKITEAARWASGQLTDDEKKQVDNEVKGIRVPLIAAIMQSSNLYAYCINNPVNLIDSTGNVTASLNCFGDLVLTFTESETKALIRGGTDAGVVIAGIGGAIAAAGITSISGATVAAIGGVVAASAAIIDFIDWIGGDKGVNITIPIGTSPLNLIIPGISIPTILPN